MPAAVAVIGGFVGGVVSAVGAVVGSIAGMVGSLVSSIGSAIGGIASAIGSVVFEPIGQIATTIGTTVTNIVTQLNKGIKDLKGWIDATTKPILEPIKNAWQTINNYIEQVKEKLKPALEPFEEVADVLNTYRDIKILGRILTSSENISRLVDYVKDGKLLQFGRAIADLYDMIAATTVGILERQEAERKTFDEKLRYIDTSIRSFIEETQSKTLKKVYGYVTGLTGKILGKIAEIDETIGRIRRRTEDLPWFKQMLLKALE